MKQTHRRPQAGDSADINMRTLQAGDDDEVDKERRWTYWYRIGGPSKQVHVGDELHEVDKPQLHMKEPMRTIERAREHGDVE